MASKKITKEDISNDKKDIKKVIPNFEMPIIHSNVVLNTVTVLATFAVLLFVAYAAFSGVYTTTTNKLIADVQTKISNLNTQTAKVNSDITYVNQNTKSYTEINEKNAAEVFEKIAEIQSAITKQCSEA